MVPCAVAYDLVIEDFILARQRVKRSQRSFGRELAEMVRYAVGYRSRAIVTFGTPIPVDGYDAHSKSDVLALAHRTRHAIGLLMKVVPTAIVAAAMRPSITRRELEGRATQLVEALAASGANMDVSDPREAVEQGARAFVARGVLVLERGRFRIRERNVLRYYARSIEHLLHTPADRTH